MCILKRELLKDTHVHFEERANKGYPCAFLSESYERRAMCIVRTEIVKDFKGIARDAKTVGANKSF